MPNELITQEYYEIYEGTVDNVKSVIMNAM